MTKGSGVELPKPLDWQKGLKLYFSITKKILIFHLPKPLDWQKGLKLLITLVFVVKLDSSKAIRLAKRIET